MFHCPKKHALCCTYSDFSPPPCLPDTALFTVSIVLPFPEGHVVKSHGKRPFRLASCM